MKKNTIIWLSVGGVLLVGGILFLALRRKKGGETLDMGVSESPSESDLKIDLPKIDLGSILGKKKKAEEDKYALMKRLEIPQSVIDATKKADQKNKFDKVISAYPTINVGGVNLPTTNSNMDAISRLNPTKISTSFSQTKKSPSFSI